MKYKLIKLYPGSAGLDYILAPLRNGASPAQYYLHGNYFEPKDFPEMWEEVKEPKYQILSFIGMENSIDGTIWVAASNDLWTVDEPEAICWTLDELKERYKNNLKIYSIKRLSDGVVFTVGDLMYGGCGTQKILKIEIDGDKVWLHYRSDEGRKKIYTYSLEEAKKQDILFTTEDGKEIRSGDKYFLAYNDKHTYKPQQWTVGLYEQDSSKVIPTQTNHLRDHGIYRFSTKEAAEEWILWNKPTFSVQMIKNIVTEVGSFHYTPFIEYVKNHLNDEVI